MNKLYYQAMKCLPEEFVDGKTQVIQYAGYVIAAHPAYKPIAFDNESGEWKDITIEGILPSGVTGGSN